MTRSIFKSPFVSGAISCFVALLGDMVWISSSILGETFDKYPTSISNIVVLILFIISFLFMCYSVYRYLRNGYITKECSDELEYRAKEHRKNLFKLMNNKYDNSRRNK